MNSINPYQRPLSANNLKVLNAPIQKLETEYSNWGKIILNNESSNHLKKNANLNRARIRRLCRHKKNKKMKLLDSLRNKLRTFDYDPKKQSKDYQSSNFRLSTSSSFDVLDRRAPCSSDESGSNMSYDYDSKDSDSDSNTTDGYPYSD